MKVKFKENGFETEMNDAVAELYIKKGKVESVKEKPPKPEKVEKEKAPKDGKK